MERQVRAMILDEDMIVAVGSDENAGVEIGNLPPGVGLERLRWDGKNVVDLQGLTEMYVKEFNGAYSLHAVQVQGSELVPMTYGDRKNLKTDPATGIIRVKTQQEKTDEANAIAVERTKTAIKKTIDFADLVDIVDHIVQIVANNKPGEISVLSTKYNSKTELASLLTSLREKTTKVPK